MTVQCTANIRYLLFSLSLLHSVSKGTSLKRELFQKRTLSEGPSESIRMGFGKVVRETLLEFGQQTSIAGIGLVISKKSYAKKVYWSILFVLMLVLTLQGLIETILNFYEREVTTSIDLDYVPSVIFPAVSICNLNKVHCANLMEQTERTQKRYTIELSKGNSTVKATNATLATLTKLFTTSGCKTQMCSVLAGKLPTSSADFANLDKTIYDVLVAADLVGCFETVNCGSTTAESCESCTSCSGPEDFEADCLFEPGGKGNPDQCVLKTESTFYRNCYLWLRFNDNNTNFQDYKPNLVIKKIIEYGCNTTAKEETCAFEGINLPGPPGAPARRKRNAPPSPPWEKPKVCITNANGQAGQNSNSKSDVTVNTKTNSETATSSNTGANTNSETNKDGTKDTESGKVNSDTETIADSKTNSEKVGGGGGGARKKRSLNGPKENGDAAEQPAVNNDFSSYAEFLQLFMELPTDVRHDIGHLLAPVNFTTLGEKISGLIVGCTYKGGSCMGQKYWFPFTTAEYGNCYAFNSHYNKHVDKLVPRKSTLTGSLYGLSVEIFLDQTYYMLNKLSKRAGAKVVIHDPKTAPLPDEYGLDLQPNTASSMSVQKTDITRLELPYVSNCTARWNFTGYEGIPTEAKYSLASCQRFCLQKDIAEECECFHPNLVQATIDTTFGYSPCLITPSENNTDYVCFNGIMNEHDNFTRSCNCTIACDETDFSAIVTTSTWPSNQYWYDLALDLGYSDSDLQGDPIKKAEAKEKVQQDYTRVDVYFQTLNVKSIVQSPTYPPSSLVSNVGGALSLYLGIAIIMAFELLELLWDVLVAFFLHCAKSKPKSRHGGR